MLYGVVGQGVCIVFAETSPYNRIDYVRAAIVAF